MKILLLLLTLLLPDLTSVERESVRAASLRLWTIWFAHVESIDDLREIKAIFNAAHDDVLAASSNDPPTTTPGAVKVASGAIAWSFKEEATVGFYANGDPWVVGPVTIVAIDPPSSVVGARTINGTMLNPKPGFTHGYDSGTQDGAVYLAALNAGLRLPLVVQPGTSVVSSKSIVPGGVRLRPALETASVLTVVAQPEPDGAMRPAYCGTNKKSPGNANDIDWSKLPSLPLQTDSAWLGGVETPLRLVSPERAVARVWLDHVQDYSGRTIHPSDNMPVYGAEIEEAGGAVALYAMSQNGLEELRRAAAIGLAQVGIDFYGIVEAGADPWHWNTGGGHGSGRLGPILWAGWLLERQDMLTIRSRIPFVNFNEIGQTYYLPDGTPEWCDQANRNQTWCDTRWAVPSTGATATLFTHLRYRTSDTSRARWAWCAAYELAGLRESVAHEALFEYQERYYMVQVLGDPGALPQTHTKLPSTLADWKFVYGK